MSEFKEGDVVKLKSGGPKMTITCVESKETTCRCMWFDQMEQLKDEYFLKTCIEIYTSPLKASVMGPGKACSDWSNSKSPDVYPPLNNTQEISCKSDSLKGSSNMMSDYDLFTKVMKYSPEEAEAMIEKLKIQKLNDVKMQMIASNPSGLMVGMSKEQR